MEEHYSRAINLYNEGDFSRAIYHWQEILKIDSEQSAPTALIKQARAKLSDQLGPLEKAMEQDIAAGQYEQALSKCRDLIDKDASSIRYKDLKSKLENVTAIKSAETSAGKVPQLVRKGLSAHLSFQENPKLAVNALRYAEDLQSTDASLKKLIRYMEDQYPAVAKSEAAAPGMSVAESKLFIALNNIYEGRYDLAIFACNEVLEMEPDNVLAFKRKGSAYFALNQKDKAREIWQQALKLTPNDSEIKQFLAEK